MILMGSAAARIRGDLPSWAKPFSDYDIVGSHDDLMALRGDPRDETIIYRNRGNGRHAIWYAGDPQNRIVIDFTSDQVESSRLLAELPMEYEASVLGHMMKIVTPQTEYVSKLAYRDFDIHRDKNDEWIAYWGEVIPEINWTPDLLAFHDALWHEYAVYLSV